MAMICAKWSIAFWAPIDVGSGLVCCNTADTRLEASFVNELRNGFEKRHSCGAAFLNGRSESQIAFNSNSDAGIYCMNDTPREYQTERTLLGPGE